MTAPGGKPVSYTHLDVYKRQVKCQELAKEKAAIAEELEELYMKWEELAEDGIRDGIS